MKTAIAIRHVPFEDLGSFAPILRERGFEVRYADAGVDDVAALDPQAADLAVILGGPIGVYEDARYPVLRDELSFLA